MRLSHLNRMKDNFIEENVVLTRLMDVFGPRGIQHYIYLGVIKQIESIANTYLSLLAQGGIQITLQSDLDVDKIVKVIHIRSVSDGEYRERGLSQLSGGQWRRVSLALDLAFTELVRRRGILRSNLMVMDEVLTHLDASGREAVGSVLRAMAKGLGNANGDLILVTSIVNEPIEYSDDEFNGNKGIKKLGDLEDDISKMLVKAGSYETVIVILQDLVAMELEEAFDHIDVVVKESDVSRVIIDQ